jgi:hypothetical protein
MLAGVLVQPWERSSSRGGAVVRSGTGSRTRWSAAWRAALASGLAALACGGARAQVVDPSLWVTDGAVHAIAQDGNTLYIGGDFSHVGPDTGPFALLDAASGAARTGWPIVDGSVYAVAPDGAGGWYLGGQFVAVGGVGRSCIAHVRADRTLDAWNPNADGPVDALVVSNGVVYAGGFFTGIGGQSRAGIAALDPTTGQATAWNPNAPANSAVFTLAVGNGVIYAGGGFADFGGQPRSNLAALDPVTALATTWNPNADSPVFALAVGNGVVYAGGAFANVGGQPRNNLAALDAASGLATAWTPDADNAVFALAVGSGVVYAGGGFANIGGQPRNGLAALDPANGHAAAWNPDPDGTVLALAVGSGVVYAGGGFANIGGRSRNNLAALDATSGQAAAWSADADNSVFALAAGSGVVAAGGGFTSVGGQTRNGIAALDATTGRATDWNPNPPAGTVVDALAVGTGVVYAGGSFATIGGQSRSGLAALDPVSGLATAWSPNPTGNVLALAVGSGFVVAGGSFTDIGGQARSGLAALDPTSGLATTWNPDPVGILDPSVHALAVGNGVVYAGGSFTSIGGQPRNNLAALDPASGLATAWNPDAGASFNVNEVSIQALALGSGVVYAAGAFVSIGGQSRARIAALDATTGLATAWDPGADNSVSALAVGSGVVYAGGAFTSIGMQVRDNLAELDATSGLATAWNPNPGSTIVSALAVGGGAVYAGGDFAIIGGRTQPGLARLYPTPVSSPSVTVVSPVGGDNVNVGTVRRITWTATAPSPGIQSVDVSLSRTGVGGPWVLLAAAAPNTGHFDWSVTGPASGTCFVRVTARDWTGASGSGSNVSAFTIGSGLASADPGAGVTAFSLSAPAPDPVRDGASLGFAVPHAARVRLSLYDVQGREVAVLVNDVRASGRYTVAVDAGHLEPGLYFLRLRGPGANLTRRLVIAR